MCIAGGAQTPLAHCRSGDADPAASTPHPSRRSTPGSPTWAPTNLPMERKRQRQVRAPSTVAPHHAHFSLFPSTRESHQKLGPISPKPAPSPPAPARRSLPAWPAAMSLFFECFPRTTPNYGMFKSRAGRTKSKTTLVHLINSIS